MISNTRSLPQNKALFGSDLSTFRQFARKKRVANPSTFIANGGTITKRRLRKIDLSQEPPSKVAEDHHSTAVKNGGHTCSCFGVTAAIELDPC